MSPAEAEITVSPAKLELLTLSSHFLFSVPKELRDGNSALRFATREEARTDSRLALASSMHDLYSWLNKLLLIEPAALAWPMILELASSLLLLNPCPSWSAPFPSLSDPTILAPFAPGRPSALNWDELRLLLLSQGS